MSEAAYTARASAREATKTALAKLPLPRNDAGQYTHEDANTFLLGTHRDIIALHEQLGVPYRYLEWREALAMFART